MHRLFVAIRPPAQVRAELLAIMGGVPGARWQDDDQLHITLRFIGEIDRRHADDVADLLCAVCFAPFELILSGIGCFSRKGHVHTLWTGAQPNETLAQLHHKIDRACVRAGLPPEDRAYHPHLTLARLGRTAGPTDSFVSRHAALTSTAFTVHSFALFESHLGRSGSTYQMVERYGSSCEHS